MFEVANYVEAGLWGGMALVLFGASLRAKGHARSRAVLTAVALLAFGASDLIEVQTGAWWRPFWLLLLKVCCVGVLAVLLVLHLRATRGR